MYSDKPGYSFVALQTMWRTCGTYMWTKFRGIDTFHSFYEPCHELLLNHSTAINHRIQAILRHPTIAQYPGTEYPVEAGGGVRYFQKRFSYENHYMSSTFKDLKLCEYIASLITHAGERKKLPLAKFCRWSLRTDWINSTFSPLSIYVLRDPSKQWQSYWSLGGKRSYFVVGSILILSKNRSTWPFAEIASEYALPSIEANTVAEELASAARWALNAEEANLRDLFGFLWAMSLKHNARFAHLLIDISLLEVEKKYRNETQDKLRKLLGIQISFEDIQPSGVGGLPGSIFSDRGQELTARILHTFEPTCDLTGIRVNDNARRLLDTIT